MIKILISSFKKTFLPVLIFTIFSTQFSLGSELCKNIRFSQNIDLLLDQLSVSKTDTATFKNELEQIAEFRLKFLFKEDVNPQSLNLSRYVGSALSKLVSIYPSEIQRELKIIGITQLNQIIKSKEARESLDSHSNRNIDTKNERIRRNIILGPYRIQDTTKDIDWESLKTSTDKLELDKNSFIEFGGEKFSLQMIAGRKPEQVSEIGHFRDGIDFKEISGSRLLSWAEDGRLLIWKKIGGQFVPQIVLGKAIYDFEPTAAGKGHNVFTKILGAYEAKNGDIVSWDQDGRIVTWRAIGNSWEVVSNFDFVTEFNGFSKTNGNYFNKDNGIRGILALNDGLSLLWPRDEAHFYILSGSENHYRISQFFEKESFLQKNITGHRLPITDVVELGGIVYIKNSSKTLELVPGEAILLKNQ